MVKWFSQRVSRKIALLALMVALVFVAGVTGAPIFFVLFVPAFLCELVADPQFRGGNLKQFIVSVSEPYLSSLFERPPPISLA